MLTSQGFQDGESPARMFKGFCFHTPNAVAEKAVKVAINARFSLIGVSCAGYNNPLLSTE